MHCLSECDGCDIEKQLSELQLDLLEHCGDGFIDYRDFLIGMIMAKTNGEELLKGRIRALPNGKALLHGDFHPGNVMLDSGGGKVIIDLMNMCCGPKEFDIARTFFLLNFRDEERAFRYLKYMNTEIEEIEVYLDIIRECRKYE